MTTNNSANATNVNHALSIGTGELFISLTPSVTSGKPIISQGSSADPDYGEVIVEGGGTSATSLTAFSVICAGETSTGAFQSVASVGSAGQMLISNGAGQLPSFQDVTAVGFSSIVIQVFTSNGTYTPTSGMSYCIAEVTGGGAGGGGLSADGQSGGGGAGGYCRKAISAATIGASQSVTVGAGGAGGTNTPTDGTNGGTSALGGLCNATGGTGGGGASTGTGSGGAGGIGSSGDFNQVGQPGQLGQNTMFGGGGGGFSPSCFGFGGSPSYTGPTNAGGYGGGGSGRKGSAGSGGDGTDGIVVITEFVS